MTNDNNHAWFGRAPRPTRITRKSLIAATEEAFHSTEGESNIDASDDDIDVLDDGIDATSARREIINSLDEMNHVIYGTPPIPSELEPSTPSTYDNIYITEKVSIKIELFKKRELVKLNKFNIKNRIEHQQEYIRVWNEIAQSTYIQYINSNTTLISKDVIIHAAKLRLRALNNSSSLKVIDSLITIK